MGVVERGMLEWEFRKALRHKDEHEAAGSDCCAIPDQADAVRSPELHRAISKAGEQSDAWSEIRDADVGRKVPYGGTVLADIKGMGKVYDWRSSPWTPVNGGKIRPLLFVDHIPVIHNMPGIADFIRLRDVLVAQGLMVQTATDNTGNVALYTPLNYLNYQARGANQFSAGCEHMHYLTSEPWSERQIRATAYVHWRWREYQGGHAYTRARLGFGNGIVRVLSRGYTTHKDVSHYAGYNDRSDPGLGLERDYEKIERGVRYFDKHHDFKRF